MYIMRAPGGENKDRWEYYVEVYPSRSTTNINEAFSVCDPNIFSFVKNWREDSEVVHLYSTDEYLEHQIRLWFEHKAKYVRKLCQEKGGEADEDVLEITLGSNLGDIVSKFQTSKIYFEKIVAKFKTSEESKKEYDCASCQDTGMKVEGNTYPNAHCSCKGAEYKREKWAVSVKRNEYSNALKAAMQHLKNGYSFTYGDSEGAFYIKMRLDD